LEAPSGYCTHWMLPAEVQRLLRSHDINIHVSGKKFMHGKDHINTAGLAIFAWFSQACSSSSKSYYDSDDAQNFYSSIWGDETVHLGRYDMVTEEEKKTLAKSQQISRAEELHELEFIKLIAGKFQVSNETPKMRILDMGCGYGGLLRRLWSAGHVWRAVGCDISVKMCEQSRRLNDKLGAGKDIEILEESYLSVSVPDESMDLVISMDALLHIGPEGQKTAVKEAARSLRPGGWMIFCDIMEQEVVDATEMQPIYDRIHLSKMGTVSNYRACLEESGFTKFEFLDHSKNVASHYGTVREALIEKRDTINVSADFLNRMEAGLADWQKLAPKNIQWGFIVAQKTNKVE
jgi:sarcosine/dimethylglycine N-methyltransferase